MRIEAAIGARMRQRTPLTPRLPPILRGIDAQARRAMFPPLQWPRCNGNEISPQSGNFYLINNARRRRSCRDFRHGGRGTIFRRRRSFQPLDLPNLALRQHHGVSVWSWSCTAMGASTGQLGRADLDLATGRGRSIARQGRRRQGKSAKEELGSTLILWSA